MLQRLRKQLFGALCVRGRHQVCFDKISHEWLLAHIPMEKGILRKWLKAGFIDKNVLHPTEEALHKEEFLTGHSEHDTGWPREAA